MKKKEPVVGFCTMSLTDPNANIERAWSIDAWPVRVWVRDDPMRMMIEIEWWGVFKWRRSIKIYVYKIVE
jgi:hypothetical protein